jgi:hypothetical protein
MPKKNPVTAVDEAIARAERRLDALQHIRALAKDDPDLLVELFAELGLGRTGRGKAYKTSTNGKTTHFDTIRKLFKEDENKWHSAPFIMKHTGLSRGAVSQVLYKGQSKEFERRKNPKHPKRIQWRLKEGGGSE